MATQTKTQIAVEVIELRYEDLANNNQKFYRAYLWESGGGMTQWGRLGTVGQFGVSNRSRARKKVDEKAGEGYQVAVNWTTFQAPITVLDSIQHLESQRELHKLANVAIGNKVSAVPAGPPGKTDAELEAEAIERLLNMRSRYSTANEPEPEPELVEPSHDLTTIEGRLGAALVVAKSKAS